MSLEIRLISPPEIAIAPRQLLTPSVQVTNTSDHTGSFIVVADTPAGWEAVAIPSSLDLDPGESAIAFISIIVPSNTLAGDYDIKLQAFRESEIADKISLDLAVTVLAINKIEIYSDRSNLTRATTGDEILQTYTVINLGNAAAKILIDVESHPDWPVTIEPPTGFIFLDPGQSSVLKVSVEVPKELSQTITHRLSVIVRADGIVMGDEISQASTRTEIIPSQLSGSMHSTLDGDISFTAGLNENDDPAYLYSIGPLHGELGDGRTVNLAMRNILIDGTRDGSFIHRQQIWGTYYNEGTGFIRLGDLPLNLDTPLMTRYLSGRIGDVLVDFGRYDLRFFLSRARGSSSRENNGMQFVYRPGENITMHLTALERLDSSGAGVETDETARALNMGFSLRISPSPNSWIQGELGSTDSEIPGSNKAWRFSGSHRSQRWSANAEWLKAGEGYLGGWTDTEIRRMGLRWNIDENINIWGNYNDSQNNLPSDPEFEGRNFRNVAYGSSWLVEGIGQLRLLHREIREQESMIQSFHSNTRLTSYSISRSWDDLNVSIGIERETTTNLISGDNERTTSPRLDIAAHIEPGSSFRLSYTEGRISSSSQPESLRARSFSLSTQIQFDSDLDFNMNFQRNTQSASGKRTDFSVLLDWEFERDHNLRFQARHLTGSFGDRSEFALEYSQPFSVPFAVFKNKGSLKGRVYMADDPESGIAGAIVDIGIAEVVTDEKGYFTFPSLEPGQYFLTLDAGSIEIGLIADLDLPLVCTVKAGESTEMDVVIIATASVSGQVILSKPASHGLPEESYAYADMLIELKGPISSEFRFTDSMGKFHFSGLRSGVYELILRKENLPSGYQVANTDTYLLDLTAGELKEGLEFIISPIERGIIIETAIPLIFK